MTAIVMVTRFAPAPTGSLHLGHIVNAIYVWGVARGHGPESRVLLRIEDHDRRRSRAVSESAILEDLAWLGFAADQPLVRQSERNAVYESALAALRARGLVYACGCSRSDIAAPRYPGTCAGRQLPESEGLGLRVRMEPAVERFDDWIHGRQEQRPAEQCGDLLVRDRDGNWTYQFAAAVDDWQQGVTLVIRGDDLLESTGRQIQLARLLGRTEAPAFLHHPLVMKSPTQKLSKSDGDTGIGELRAIGWAADQVIGHAAALAGLIDAPRRVAAREVAGLLRGRFGGSGLSRATNGG
jgi:glutamyl/glutaminyl-tRNA synthetase